MGSIVNALSGSPDQFQAGSTYLPSVLQQALQQRSDIYARQSGLNDALAAQISGNGPNPAQTQYLQNQQANIANAQGLIASQRGLNPALAARMGANQAAAANSHAGLAAALLQQQQQLGATSLAGGLLGQMQQGNLGQQQLYNDAAMGAQKLNAGVSQENAQVSGQVTGSLINALGGAGAAAAGGGKAHGGVIRGKANVPGDSKENDTVPTMLSPGEIVIPRSKAHDPEKAKEFIDHLLKSKKPKTEYKDVLAARRKKGK